MECKYCGTEMNIVSETGASIVGYWEVWYECQNCKSQYYESETQGEGWTEPTALKVKSIYYLEGLIELLNKLGFYNMEVNMGKTDIQSMPDIYLTSSGDYDNLETTMVVGHIKVGDILVGTNYKVMLI